MTKKELAVKYFAGGYNCAQSVVLAFCEEVGLTEEQAAIMSEGFGGGMGIMREVCGSVSGMVILAGLLSPADNPSDKAARTANYALVQDFAGRFREINGSIICKELLGLVPVGGGMPTANESPEPSDRTAEYYKKRPCEELVGIAARIIGEKLQVVQNI